MEYLDLININLSILFYFNKYTATAQIDCVCMNKHVLSVLDEIIWNPMDNWEGNSDSHVNFIPVYDSLKVWHCLCHK